MPYFETINTTCSLIVPTVHRSSIAVFAQNSKGLIFSTDNKPWLDRRSRSRSSGMLMHFLDLYPVHRSSIAGFAQNSKE